MKKFLSFAFLACILGSGIAMAQDGKSGITFKSTLYDYGTLKEDDGVAYHDFTFTNTGNSPLIIQRVTSSCGCTTPDWPKEPIAPGKTSEIKVGYNPHGRPGPFTKTITVFSNSETPSLVLQIKGNVAPHVKTIDEIYRIPVGDNLRFEKNHIPFRRMFLGSTYTDTLKFMNSSTETVKVAVNASGMDFLKINVVPESVKPKEFGNIIVTYIPDKRNDWGFLVDRFVLVVNGQPINNAPLSVSGSIEEDFSKLTQKELDSAPKISVDNAVYDFGDHPDNENVNHNFVIKNEGKSDLIIRKIKASCGCTTVTPDKEILKPGETTNIQASFRTSGYSGRQSKIITIITNDPKNSTLILRLTGNVVKSK
ncbi:MAG: DUF1573 domain-containing protein [Bacteroidales bacterium]|nr:DUF1573 domain-containing protein [Bacteroidales bacterium]HPD95092.1 DUF1573 domain-containing protein [Tenuifilaceae bacterium]HRX31548.1 DUF1573 domain-containing protein [Tenuifilaceae bacterium]